MEKKYKAVLAKTKKAAELLDMYYLDIRSALLESASFFDRLDRAEDSAPVASDKRVSQLREICRMVQDLEPRRTERILEFLSEEES